MKNLYVMFTRTSTMVGKMIRVVTKYEFSHVSLALSDDLTEFYSFARRNMNNAIDGGFVKEKRYYFTHGKESRTRVKIFKIPVEDEVYYQVKSFVKQIASDDEVIYNLFSLITMPIVHGIQPYKQYTCISFVSEALSKTGLIKFNKPTYKYTPKELERILKKYLFLDGYISNGKVDTNDKFFEPIDAKKGLAVNILFIYECFYRLIYKKASKRYINHA